MKKKFLCITILLTICIIISGAIGLPFLYSIFVDVPDIIEEQTALPQTLETEQKQFMKSILFPLLEETRQLSETEKHSYRNAMEEYICFEEQDKKMIGEGFEMPETSETDISQTGYEFFKNLFLLAGFSYKEPYGNDISSVIDSPNYYILEKKMKRDNTSYFLSIALKDYLPVLLYCENQSMPSAQDLENAAKVLKKYADTQDSYLRSYLKKIDQFYSKAYVDYKKQIKNLYQKLLPQNKKEGDGENRSLLDCCSYGKWQVYTDDKIAALVCIMEKSYFVLYYDAVDQSFCGFRNGIE